MATNEIQGWRAWLKAIVRTVWIFLNNTYVTLGYLIWMFLLRPVCLVKPDLYWKIEGYLFKWTNSVVSNWIWSCGHTVEEMGDDIRPYHDDEVLFLPNHQATGDVGLIMYVFHHHGNVSNNMYWVMWDLFKYVTFGWVSLVHHDFFISSGKETLQEFRKHLKQYYCGLNRKWLVLFPEGTFLSKGKASSQRFALKNGYPVLENVSLPRIGALQAALETLNTPNGNKNKKIKYIIDVTIGYPEGTPLNIYNVVFDTLSPRKVTFLYRVLPVDQVPLEGSQLQDWAFNLYVEKEKLLDEYYKTGSFPELPANSCSSIKRMRTRVLNHNLASMLAVQVPFMLAWLVLYRLVTKAYMFLI